MNLREAAQVALQALQESKPIDIDDPAAFYRSAHAIEALRAGLAQPEPEPVAWMYDWYDETEDIDGVPIGGIVHDWISKDYDEAHSPTMGCHNIRPLYATPPQREWVGLTDEEQNQVAWSCGAMSADWLDFARAIESKLREKNL